MRFEFATASRILFGPGTLGEVGPLARELGRRALIVTGRNPERAQALLETLAAHRVESVRFATSGEPTTESVQAGTRQARQEGCDLVIGFGGGSAVDAAKAVAALLANAGDLLDYLEVVGRGRPITKPSVPCIAIPTTAGAGAEVTRNAVLSSPSHRVKASLRSPYLLARLAVVDPELTHGLPPELTACTGLDALTQLIEPFVSCRANPLADSFCREGIRRAGRALRQACDNGRDAAAREDMSLAALFSGLALANAGLGAVHGFAAPVGGMFPAPHGAVCAALLPHVMEINIRALRQRQPAGDALRRYVEMACLLTGKAQAHAEDGIAWARETCAALGIPSLGRYGLTRDDVPVLCEKAAAASSMKGNPIPLTTTELKEILEQAI